MTTPAELTAMLVCPDRGLAQQFSAAVAELKALNIIAEVKEYVSPVVLDQRMKQLRPDAVLIDVGSDRQAALALVGHLAAAHPGAALIGLHGSNDPDSILLCMRNGVAEFLHAPFLLTDSEQAIMRLVRRKQTEVRNQPSRGRLIAFVPAKGGAGTTTLATNIAHRLSRASPRRVLVADFDLAEGTVAFLFKLNHAYSLLDAVKHSHQLDESLWGSLVAPRGNLDILPAPEKPYAPPIEAYRVHECLEYARSIYEHVVVDLSSISDKLAAATLTEADRLYLVTSPELPSLFLARKTLSLLEEMGFHKEQMQVLVNRVHKREELSPEDMEKIFRFPVLASFPSDAAAVRRALTEGKPVEDSSDLGGALRRFVERFEAPQREARKKAPSAGLRGLFSEGQLVKG